MADQPWHELPPEIVDVLRPALADVADEMIQAVATVPAYARPLEGPFGEGIRAGVQEALRHFLAEIRGRRCGDAPRRLLGAGPRRDAGRPQPRVAAQRLPDRRPGRLAAVRRRRRGGRAGARDAVPAGRVDLRLHRRAVGRVGRGLRARAVGRGQRGRAAAPAPGARCWSAIRPPTRTRSRRPPPRPAGRCPARWPWWRSPASSAAPPPRGCPPGSISEAIGELTCALVGRSRRPRTAGGDRAGGARGRARAPGSARRSTGRRRGSASPGRARRWSWPSEPRRRSCRARERAGELLLRSDPRLAEELAADRLAPLRRAHAGLARAADRDAAGLAGRAGAARARSPSGSGSTRRRRATGWAGCASCSATRWTHPDGRFWLELALRARRPAQAAGLTRG